MKHCILPTAALLAATLSLSIPTAASAGETAVNPTHVVELFTSQGCSSCPPANRFVTKISENPDTLVLSYGVTYWDFLGWKDTFGRLEFTQRQRDYRDAFGASNIYTPQIILGGSAHSPRYSKRDVADMGLPETGIDLSIDRSGGTLEITADAPEGTILDIVSYTPGEQTVDVKRGENSGRVLSLTNVVTDVQTLKWDGKSVSVRLPKSESTVYAALVHDRETAKILDAAIIK